MTEEQRIKDNLLLGGWQLRCNFKTQYAATKRDIPRSLGLAGLQSGNKTPGIVHLRCYVLWVFAAIPFVFFVLSR